jgi:hypothetical protein
VARSRTTVNGRHGLADEIKHLQDVRLLNCEQPQGLQSREIESQKAEQKKEYRNEDMNAAAVVYANYSKSRSNAKMPEIPEERGRGEGEERRGARTPCTVTAPAGVAGHRLPVWATKIGGDSL